MSGYKLLCVVVSVTVVIAVVITAIILHYTRRLLLSCRKIYCCVADDDIELNIPILSKDTHIDVNTTYCKIRRTLQCVMQCVTRCVTQCVTQYTTQYRNVTTTTNNLNLFNKLPCEVLELILSYNSFLTTRDSICLDIACKNLNNISFISKTVTLRTQYITNDMLTRYTFTSIKYLYIPCILISRKFLETTTLENIIELHIVLRCKLGHENETYCSKDNNCNVDIIGCHCYMKKMNMRCTCISIFTFRRFSSLKTLYIGDHYPINGEMCTAIFAMFDNLTSLTIMNSMNLLEVDFYCLILHIKNLKSLHLFQIRFILTEEEMPDHNLENLTLSRYNYLNHDDDNIKLPGKIFTSSLKILTLIGWHRVEKKLENCINLQKLTLCYQHLTIKESMDISQLASLEELILEYVMYIYEPVKSTTVKKLTLMNMYWHSLEYFSIPSIENLELHDMGRCENYMDVLELLQYFPQLTLCCMTRNENIVKELIKELVKYLHVTVNTSNKCSVIPGFRSY